jgi:CDP-diacylglycerol--serine O-phosphatidyltransferase
MLRTFVLADFLTLGNAACGASTVLLCLESARAEPRASLVWAFLLLPLALVLDVLDGWVARWRHQQSPLGADLDSLADIVSFGVAPASLAFALGVDGGWDAVVLVFFVACGISRLARFNATAAQLSDGTGKVRYYQGTPIPSSLLLVAMLGIAFATDHTHASLWLGEWALGPFRLHPLVLAYAASGAAMVSGTLKIPKP